MKRLFIPNKQSNSRIQAILFGKKINLRDASCDFNTVRRKIYNSKELEAILKTNGIPSAYELSSGTSDIPCWEGYKNQLVNDLVNDRYYREYTTAKGNVEAREALAYMESNKPFCTTKYEADDICLTEGSTGAITSLFEYVNQTNPTCEVIISTPNYYLYAFTAKYFGMRMKEVYGIPTKQNPSFIDINEIIKAISAKTKLIVITNPTNPGGEIYQIADVLKLYTICTKQNILLMVDELFGELIFSGQTYAYMDTVLPKNAKNLVIVKGFSKTKNLPGLRIGYVFSKNRTIIDAISVVSQQRQCFPVASTFSGILSLDAFMWSVTNKQIVTKGTIRQSITQTLKTFPKNETIQKNNINELKKIFLSYISYRTQLLNSYSCLYNLSLSLLINEIELALPKQTAFNTFVKIRFPKNCNYFDFMLNLYLTTGVKIEFSPCFGLTQKQWENNPKLGFWLRITFARNTKILSEGITRLIEFKKYYFKNKDTFIATNVSF